LFIAYSAFMLDPAALRCYTPLGLDGSPQTSLGWARILSWYLGARRISCSFLDTIQRRESCALFHRSLFDQALDADGGDAVWNTALNVQEAASSEGFDWPDAQGVLDKIAEETEEIRAALAAGDAVHAQKELGDLLLASVNLARFLHILPGQALGDALARFVARYDQVKLRLAEGGKLPGDCSLEELDAIWASVKIKELRPLEEEA